MGKPMERFGWETRLQAEPKKTSEGDFFQEESF